MMRDFTQIKGKEDVDAALIGSKILKFEGLTFTLQTELGEQFTMTLIPDTFTVSVGAKSQMTLSGGIQFNFKNVKASP